MVSAFFPPKGLTIIYIIALFILTFQLIETKKFRGPTKCTLPKDPGHECQDGKLRRWYFDIETGRCRIFEFRGCGGNENNFRGIRECERVCRNWLAFHNGI